MTSNHLKLVQLFAMTTFFQLLIFFLFEIYIYEKNMFVLNLEIFSQDLNSKASFKTHSFEGQGVKYISLCFYHLQS